MGFILQGLDAKAYDRTYGDWQLIRRIASYFRPKLAVMAFVTVMVVLNSLMDASLPVMLARGVDVLVVDRTQGIRGSWRARSSLQVCSRGRLASFGSGIQHGPSVMSCSGSGPTRSAQSWRATCRFMTSLRRGVL